MKKYLVVPGSVKSRSDGDIHRVTAVQLMRLYGVDPAECVVVGRQEVGRDVSDLIPLYPRFDGNYRLPHQRGEAA